MPIVALLCGGLPAAAQTGPAGHWEGTVRLPDREIQIAVDLGQDDKGAWGGTFAQLTQNVQNVPLAGLKVDGKSVKFRIAAGGSNAPDFDCSLDGPGSMNCTLTTPNGSVNVSMKRTGDAKIDLPKSSAAVAGEFEGDWEGAVETPNGPVRLTVHFRNQADKTVKATLDNPDQNAVDLPLSDVVQKGSGIEFRLRMVNGGYKGTMNKEATQLTGEWSQGGASVPLNLKKSVK